MHVKVRQGESRLSEASQLKPRGVKTGKVVCQGQSRRVKAVRGKFRKVQEVKRGQVACQSQSRRVRAVKDKVMEVPRGQEGSSCVSKSVRASQGC